MRRRELITLLGGAAAAWPLAARAQQRAMPVIGFLNGRSPQDTSGVVEAFRQGVKSTGLVEGQSMTIEFRWAHGDFDRLPKLAADLVARPVDVIVTAGGTSSALAAKAATTTIPIVFVTGADPVQVGLVGSLNRPNGNLTGVSLVGSALAAKRVELLHELVPKAAVIAVLINPTSPTTAGPQSTDAATAARVLGLQISVAQASNMNDLDLVFDLLTRRGAGGLFVTNDAFFLSQRDRLVALAGRHRIPAIFESREFSVAGGLMSYGSNTADMYRQAGAYAGRILKGAKPADLPVMQPTKFELIINLNTAKALGLEVPAKLLALADEVIE